MTHAEDTHVLIDEHGTAVMSGTEMEMLRLEAECYAMGHSRVEVRAIDAHERWDWTTCDWGD